MKKIRKLTATKNLPDLDGVAVKKILKMARFTLFCFFLGLMQVMAVDSYSQMARLSLNVNNESLENVLGKIEEETEFFFLYNKDLIDVEQKVSIGVENETIKAVLDDLLKGQDISYAVYDRQIVLTNLDVISEMVAQQKSVSGKVADAKNQSLPGVTVVIKGTAQGTVTNADGSYSLSNVPDNATLQFSFVGMESQDVVVGAKTTINVVMVEETFGIEEVVVTALGIKRSEKALGYSVQRVDGKSLQKVSSVDVASSLTGKVAGLLVRNTPDFNAAPVITIRGEQPLLVIDGVPYQNKTLSDISSEDIESLSVLKGATASALYGFRGASGAILVTTKNGTTNLAGLSVDVATNTMFSAGFLALPEVQSIYGRGNSNIYDRNSDQSWGTVMDGTIRNQWDPKLKAYADYPYTA
ncbi:MAG: carboxypeptidase-like regulatory domain-containing protein, partial [Draconibacterium sp.]|nr:carboxypeptidase-like regulatory domain-containing protein [Draconibacterium sp.]